MCMLTYLPGGVKVPSDELYNGATWNNDGHGWAVAAESRVMLTGRYMDIDTALLTFEATREAYPDAPAMFHSRWATHGEYGVINVHPFKVGKWSAVGHNGVLPSKWHPTKGDYRSDTAVCASDWLHRQSGGMWSRRERRRIGRVIGLGNKLCILSVSPLLDKPKGFLVNAHQGTWDKATGAWFSNHDFEYSYKPSKKYVSLFDDYAQASGTCPRCHTNEHVDFVSNYCEKCETCLDCGEPSRACMCYLPQWSRQGADKRRPWEDDDGFSKYGEGWLS